ncbi:MAG: dihydropteroate synthase [Solirubrobacterales bacterium]
MTGSFPVLRGANGEINVEQPFVVGVVNATPDSFSDRGDRSTAGSIRAVMSHIQDGARVIEVGGESNVTNRPAVTAEVEVERVLPVVTAAVGAGAIVSIDTYKPEVAEAALEAGAAIVNDISGSRSEEMLRVCSSYGAAMVVMHTEVPPKTQRWDEDLYPEGVVNRQVEFFEDRLAALTRAGIGRDQVVIDPGPDFGKTPAQTVESLRGLSELRAMHCPIMLAVSRKDFIGAITGRAPSERAAGTFAALACGLDQGAKLLRVHDVKGTVDFLKVWQSLRGEREVAADLRIADGIRREPPKEPEGQVG